ncbi:hypothetical protein QL285_018489 [Trifolium repens]|nr:hypothetical protein QL285_018489 [Trifolium repens]
MASTSENNTNTSEEKKIILKSSDNETFEGKPFDPEEIFKFFNIVKDFSPEEEEELRLENQWDFVDYGRKE